MREPEPDGGCAPCAVWNRCAQPPLVVFSLGSELTPCHACETAPPQGRSTWRWPPSSSQLRPHCQRGLCRMGKVCACGKGVNGGGDDGASCGVARALRPTPHFPHSSLSPRSARSEMNASPTSNARNTTLSAHPTMSDTAAAGAGASLRCDAHRKQWRAPPAIVARERRRRPQRGAAVQRRSEWCARPPARFMRCTCHTPCAYAVARRGVAQFRVHERPTHRVASLGPSPSTSPPLSPQVLESHPVSRPTMA
jgi:hypothetical protein